MGRVDVASNRSWAYFIPAGGVGEQAFSQCLDAFEHKGIGFHKKGYEAEGRPEMMQKNRRVCR